MMPLEGIGNIGDKEDLLKVTLMTLMHNHLEHMFDLFRPIPEDARQIEKLEENPPAFEASGLRYGYRIYKENGELILRTLNTLQMCLSRIQNRAPDARLAIGLVYNIRSRLVRPIADDDYFYVRGRYEDICDDIALLQDVVACSISEAVEDDAWVMSEKLYILFGTACPVCHRVFSSEGWKEFEKALETRRKMSLARKTRYGIPFMYKYVVIDVQNSSEKFFSYLSVVARGLNMPILIYYNPFSLRLIIWHSTFVASENAIRKQVKDMGPFTKVLFNLPAYFIPSKELPAPYDEFFKSMRPSWKFVYRVLFEEKPIERVIVREMGAVPQQKRASEIKISKHLKLGVVKLYSTYKDYRRDVYLTAMCDALFTSSKPLTVNALTNFVRERVDEPKPAPTTVRDLVIAYSGILFNVSKSHRGYEISLTNEARDLMKLIIAKKFNTVGEAYMAVFGKNLLTLYYDRLKEVHPRGAGKK